MKIEIKYIKDKDVFEMRIIESKLRAHFLLSRDILNNLRGVIERALLESKKKS